MLSKKAKEVNVKIFENIDGELKECETNSELYTEKLSVHLNE